MTTNPRPGTYAGYVTYCAGCGHDKATHRGGRCWVDAMGRPLYRTRSLIGCLCDEFLAVVELDDDELAASIARHPAGKRLGQP